MQLRTVTAFLTLLTSLACCGLASGGADVEAVLKQMPADFPLGAIIVDFEKLDKNAIAYGKAINPQNEFEGMLADLKKELGIAAWIDFTKPVGIAQASLQGGDPIIWATVPNFKEKVKTVAEAKEEEGVWFLPFPEMDDLYATIKGDLVIAASDKTLLESALKKEGRTLADDLRPRMELLTNRDALVHLNFDPIRPAALGGVAQAAQMAPMFAMMAGQQGGADPAALTAVVSAAIDAVRRFLEQLAYVDIGIGISPTAASGSIATGFNDGPIKAYLAKTKPASAPLLSNFNEQSFTLAAGWHIPGEDSPFIDYFFDKLGAGLPVGGGAAPGGQSAEADPAKEATQISRDLYRKVEGMNLFFHMTPKGMVTMGDYLGKDTAGILDLAKKTMTKVNPLTKSFEGGAKFESAGSKKLGDKNVDEFVVKLDPAHPASAQAAKMFGDNIHFYFGVLDGRIGYFMGPEPEAQKYFTGKVEKPLTSGKLVADALSVLPPKRNLLILLDPAGVLPALAPMIGMPAMENIPPGPPIAVSVLLSGDYARTDIHVPAKAIERVIQAVSPQPPM